ncbi:unnamed protein product [Rhodiola kirilowii]
MTTRQKETVPGKEKRGVSPMGSGSTEQRRRSLRPSTPPSTVVPKDHGKATATSSTAGEPRKHVPNYLKPTISSNPDVVKHSVVKKHAHDDSHKPTPTMMRRRSFDRPAPASQVQKAVLQSSSARGERVSAPFSPKHSAGVTRPASASSERISKVVKAVKSQPPLLKTKSLPRANSSSGVKKEVKTSNLKRAGPSKEEEPVHAPIITESEAEEQESLDLNVEEELAKMENPVDLTPENHFAEDKEQIDEENHSPKKIVNENEEKLNSSDITISDDHQDENEHTPEPVAENTENVEVSNEETQVVHENQQTDESDQQSNQAVYEAPAEDKIKDEEKEEKEKEAEKEGEKEAEKEGEKEAEKEGEKEAEKEGEKETDEEIKPLGLTVKTTPDEKDEIQEEDHEHQNSEKGAEIEKSEGEEKNEANHSPTEEEKHATSEAENVVHKRQVGGPNKKKESPAYNDVIEETASKLVGKRVNKVRALAGAFETVISLQQPDSS